MTDPYRTNCLLEYCLSFQTKIVIIPKVTYIILKNTKKP